MAQSPQRRLNGECGCLKFYSRSPSGRLNLTSGPGVDYAVGDCVTMLALCKTIRENVSKFALNATYRKKFK